MPCEKNFINGTFDRVSAKVKKLPVTQPFFHYGCLVIGFKNCEKDENNEDFFADNIHSAFIQLV